MCFPQRPKTFYATYYYLHTGPFKWPFLKFVFEKPNCCFQPLMQTGYHLSKLHFFSDFFLAPLYETKNLDSKLRTNDWPGGKNAHQRHNRVREPVFQDASSILLERMFFMFCAWDFNVNHLSNLKKEKTQKNYIACII